MKEVKFFLSLCKERDYLEKMAAQGWLLTDITLGIIYQFKKVEPCQKVFEIERFAVSSKPTVHELKARMLATDVAKQAGWEVVTHDESMNYYFMKDKAGDETDEFYDDDELRKGRAERYRKYYGWEEPLKLLAELLIVSVIFFLCDILLGNENSVSWYAFYALVATLDIAIAYFYMRYGQTLYDELSMSREQWEQKKKFSVKQSFKKVQQLRVFLQEKSEQGLVLVGCDKETFLFEEDSTRYNYYIDTKKCLKKRLKEQGNPFQDEKKDWGGFSLKWYEASIAQAEQKGMKLACVMGRNVLIYKKPYSDELLPWENGNEDLRVINITPETLLIMVCAGTIGAVIGFVIAMLTA